VVSAARRRRCQSVPSACDVNWWVVALPSLISGLAAFLAVIAGQRFASRRDKRDGEVNEFHWIIGLITARASKPGGSARYCSRMPSTTRNGGTLRLRRRSSPSGLLGFFPTWLGTMSGTRSSSWTTSPEA